MQLDDHLRIAMRYAAKYRMSAWSRELENHRRHASFHAHSWAHSREFGFTCACCGEEDEWRISVASLREMMPAARNAVQRMVSEHGRRGTKKARREDRIARIKAKALLHYNLTKEQRWDLRGSKSFVITGKDGKSYRITEGTSSNVQLLENGVATHQLCVVAKGFQLPVYDLMLAQKLMLESDPEAFWKIAVVRDLRLEDVRELRARQMAERHFHPWGIPDEAADEPEAWVTDRLTG